MSEGLPPNPYNPHAWIIGSPQIGEGTWIGAFTLIDGSGGLTIGRGCNISSGAHILTHSTVKRCVSERRYAKVETQPVEIGEYVFVGEHATILMGCQIGHHSIIAAGAVLTEGMVIPPYSLVAGVPGRIVRSIEQEIEAWSPQPGEIAGGQARRESLSMVIPAYNEEQTIEQVIRQALVMLPQHAEEYEVLIVDDGSRDGTAGIADHLASEHRHVRVIHHPHNRGFSGAMRTGLWQAQGDLIFLCPADGQASFDDIAGFLTRIDEYDLLFGHRVNRQDSVSRKLGSAVWYAYLKWLFGIQIPQFSASFLFRRPAIQALQVDVCDRGANLLPALFMAARAKGLRVGLVETEVAARAAGRSKGMRLVNTVVTVAEDLRLWWRWRIKGSLPGL